MRARSLLLALLVAFAPSAFAQTSVLQGGTWTGGHIMQYSQSGGRQPILQDGGTAAGGALGINPSEIGITARGTGTAPFSGTGSGPFGTNFCDRDGPATGAHHYLCFSANATGGNGLIAFGNANGASATVLNMNINGTVYPFPFVLSGSGVIGPGTTVASDLTCWNNTTGTLLKSCGSGVNFTGGKLFAPQIWGGNPTNWLVTEGYGDSGTAIVGESLGGDVGVTGASRNVDNNGGAHASVGVVGFNFNYNTSTPAAGWGGYFESRRVNLAGVSLGVEIDVTNFGPIGTPDPYNIFGTNSVALWLASGGGCTSLAQCWTPSGPATGTANDASIAIGIIPNGARFLKGIVVKSDALTGSTGTDADTGLSTFLELARNQRLMWNDQDNNERVWIYSTQTTAGTLQKLQFADSGTILANSNGNPMLAVAMADTYRNGVIITPAANGFAPTISPQSGGDATVDLLLSGFGPGGTVKSLTDFVFNGTLNNVTITTPATAATLTLANNKTLTVSNTVSFTGTDGSTVNFGAGGTILYSGSQITNSLGGDVALNNTGNYFDGPSVAQGSTGTWFASGTVVVQDGGGSANIVCKLWDGTTVVASGQATLSSPQPIALSGFLSAPAGNIRISCKDATAVTGLIVFNGSGNSKDSTLTAFRVQ